MYVSTVMFGLLCDLLYLRFTVLRVRVGDDSLTYVASTIGDVDGVTCCMTQHAHCVRALLVVEGD